jgi:hypothetical protein
MKSLPERFDVLVGVLETWDTNRSDHGHVWWARLCYSSVQAYGMEAYDANAPGDSLSAIFIAVIPRLLWPDKPNVSLVGEDFTELLLGRRGFQIGIGIFGEAYWNGGWGMLLVICTCIGLIFVWFSRLASRVMEYKQWLFLPCLFFGIKMGLRIDGWFVIDYVGSLFIAVGYFAILSFVPKWRLSESRRA